MLSMSTLGWKKSELFFPFVFSVYQVFQIEHNTCEVLILMKTTRQIFNSEK